MHAISVDPSVASLTKPRRGGTPGMRNADRPAFPLHDRGVSTPRLFLHTLRRALENATEISLDVSVPTPGGPIVADFVLEGAYRRVAIVTRTLTDQQEALLLVFGGYDALYRVCATEVGRAPLLSVALLESAEPALFRGDGTAQLATVSILRRIHTGRTTLTAESWDGTLDASIHRRRLNRPAEWTSAFEAALETPANRRRAS